MRKVSFQTLGCKLNFSETSTLAKSFQNKGFEVSNDPQDCHFFVLNTCSVTENADTKCKRIIRQVKRSNPNCKVIVVGCYAQLKPKEITEMEDVDLVLGAAEKFNITQYLEMLDDGQTSVQICHPVEEANVFHPSYSFGDRTRSFLKVQDGCDYSCTFCTIPMARGNSRSCSIKELELQLDEIVSKGIKEVVLTGVNIGDFGLINGKREHHFLNLIQALDQREGDFRVRISSIEPNLLSDDIIHFVSTSKHFMPHFHIPLQSGSDAILKQMRRRYLTPLYQDRITHIHQLMPQAAIGIDVIVGFPGETDELFEESYQFLASLPFTYLHIFTYSERPNTVAIDLPGKIKETVKQERRIRLEKLSLYKKKLFYQNFANTQQKILFERQEKEGLMSGFTENYIKVEIPFDADKVNQICDVLLQQFDDSREAMSAEIPTLEKTTALEI